MFSTTAKTKIPTILTMLLYLATPADLVSELPTTGELAQSKTAVLTAPVVAEAVEESVGVKHFGTFHAILTDNPTVSGSNKRWRSSTECAHKCLIRGECTGFSVSPEEGCQFYSTKLVQVSSKTKTTKYVYVLDTSEVDCLANDQFELMILDDYKYCVRIFDGEKVNGTEARDICKKHGAKVIALETRNKIDNFRSILQTRDQYHSVGYWIGLYDILAEGKFQWDKDGTFIDETNEVWDSGQPNGLEPGQGDQDCTLLVDDNRYLQDKSCSNYAVFACEISSNTYQSDAETDGVPAK